MSALCPDFKPATQSLGLNVICKCHMHQTMTICFVQSLGVGSGKGKQNVFILQSKQYFLLEHNYLFSVVPTEMIEEQSLATL
jgi:hypothetical protein